MSDAPAMFYAICSIGSCNHSWTAFCPDGVQGKLECPKCKNMSGICGEVFDCPFCESLSIGIHRNFDFVYCKTCGARGSAFDGHIEDAIESWNGVYRGEAGDV